MRPVIVVLSLVALAVAPVSGEEDLPTVTVTVAADGSATLEGKKLEGDALVRALLLKAELKRDVTHPMQPSEVRLLIRADAKATWQGVRSVIHAASDPDVRIYRLFWTTRLVAVPGEKLIEVRGAKDRGLARTKIRWHRLPDVTMEVAMGAKIRLLDRELGTGDEAFALLEAKLPEFRKRNERFRARIRPADEAAFGDVARAFDTCRAAGYKMFLGSVIGRNEPVVEFEMGPVPEGIAQAREALVKKDYAAARGLYEALFVRKKENLPKVNQILRDQAFSSHNFRQLPKLARFHPQVMTGLAKTLIACGGKDDLLLSATLSGILVRGSTLYGKDWWNAELLALRTFVVFGEQDRSRLPLKNVMKFVAAVRDLGILERAPNRKEIEALEKRAKAALAN